MASHWTTSGGFPIKSWYCFLLDKIIRDLKDEKKKIETSLKNHLEVIKRLKKVKRGTKKYSWNFFFDLWRRQILDFRLESIMIDYSIWLKQDFMKIFKTN